MSDRTIPRSLRMIEGFGVHTFRLVNAAGKSTFVKFHWRPTVGAAVDGLGRGGEDRRRRSRLSIAATCSRAIDARRLPGMGRSACSVRPGDRRRARLRHPRRDQAHPRGDRAADGRSAGWCSTASPDNFFAETEQVAFCPATSCPGIDFSNDPLLQGRLFSYLDTQLSRLGAPNFHQIPINAPVCPFQQLPARRPHADAGAEGPRQLRAELARCPTAPRENPERGFTSFPDPESGPKLRAAAGDLRRPLLAGAAVLPLDDAARAGQHRVRAHLRAQQGRDASRSAPACWAIST